MARTPKKRTPGISLTAGAKVRELRFERVPETGTRFFGQREQESESGTVRENLPEEAERNVVYRDVRVRWRAISEITGAQRSLEEREADARTSKTVTGSSDKTREKE